jgi:hypothetical protein
LLVPFFPVQNKLHWAIHGRTAAELISERADASKPNMGLTPYSQEVVQMIKDSSITTPYSRFTVG